MPTTETTIDAPLDLATLGRELLEQARRQPAGRAARTLTPGSGAPLKQVVLALAAGRRLQDHRAGGPATLQVLSGDVQLTWDGQAKTVRGGEWTPIPDAVHGVTANEDSVALLTVGAPASTRLAAEDA